MNNNNRKRKAKVSVLDDKYGGIQKSNRRRNFEYLDIKIDNLRSEIFDELKARDHELDCFQNDVEVVKTNSKETETKLLKKVLKLKEKIEKIERQLNAK